MIRVITTTLVPMLCATKSMSPPHQMRPGYFGWIPLSVLSLTHPPLSCSLDFLVEAFCPLCPSVRQHRERYPGLELHNKRLNAWWTIRLLANSQRHWLLPACVSVWLVSFIKSGQQCFLFFFNRGETLMCWHGGNVLLQTRLTLFCCDFKVKNFILVVWFVLCWK